MSDRILERLEPVRRRQLGLEVLRFAGIGLLAGSLLGVGLGVWRWQGAGGGAAWAVYALAILMAGPAIGAMVGLARGRSFRLAAAMVDRTCQLKDRAVTAVDFIRRGQPTPLHELQVADAERHLDGLDPRRVAPFRLPAAVPCALGAMFLALGLLLWPRPTPVHAQPAQPLESVLAAAEEAEESIEDLQEAAKKEKDPKLAELVQKLTETIQEMKLPGVDTKEALAKLSEMQAAITAQQAQFNVGLVDAQMQALGEAMASTQALEGAGQALQQGKYDLAAAQLEKADPKFDRKETKTLKEKLAQAAKGMEEAGLTDLSTATTELAESLDDEATAQGACKKLGNLARGQGRRKRISDLLTLQTRNLSECKCNCQKNSTAKLRLRKKSDKPTSNWGMGISGNTDGDRTKLDSARKREQVQGQMGEGASETETTQMPEGRQTAARTYREQYQKYRRMTEAALNSEPIPLGHRQTIRRYFELIRPQGDEAEKADPKAGANAKPVPTK
ncbi:MAG: hypothetical protein ACHRXM_32820 [Isosphaerales bacterium]